MNGPIFIVSLANGALAAGMDMGFNAVIVYRQYIVRTNKTPVLIKFGDKAELSKIPLLHVIECARAYCDEVPCIRKTKEIELDDTEGLTMWDIQSKIREQLLELADG